MKSKDSSTKTSCHLPAKYVGCKCLSLIDFRIILNQLSLVSAASYGSRCSNQVWTTTGRFRGVVVRIKELKFTRKKDISRELMKEFRTLRDLRHDNINSFIGNLIWKL
jgi:hypothetical protein